jgi:membrane-associated HD superfamily phosphohydrolase
VLSLDRGGVAVALGAIGGVVAWAMANVARVCAGVVLARAIARLTIRFWTSVIAVRAAAVVTWGAFLARGTIVAIMAGTRVVTGRARIARRTRVAMRAIVTSGTIVARTAIVAIRTVVAALGTVIVVITRAAGEMLTMLPVGARSRILEMMLRASLGAVAGGHWLGENH